MNTTAPDRHAPAERLGEQMADSYAIGRSARRRWPAQSVDEAWQRVSRIAPIASSPRPGTCARHSQHACGRTLECKVQVSALFCARMLDPVTRAYFQQGFEAVGR